MRNPCGFIQLKDRSKDIIVSGGENISSIEVEEALYRHPAVEAAAVVAMPHQKWGETPCAFVELAAGRQADQEALRTWCRHHLASYKVPGLVVFLPIPRTSTGKIKKFSLRQKATEIAKMRSDESAQAAGREDSESSSDSYRGPGSRPI